MRAQRGFLPWLLLRLICLDDHTEEAYRENQLPKDVHTMSQYIQDESEAVYILLYYRERIEPQVRPNVGCLH